MFVMHVALGGCLRAPPVRFGITEDTGGHITYVLGAARAMAARADVSRVEVVTRLFHDSSLGAVHAAPRETGEGYGIVRVPTRSRGYLSKEALADEVEDFTAALIDHIGRLDRVPDVIHAHFADAAQVALAIRARFGCRVVYTPHSLAADKVGADDPGPRLRSRLALERMALARSDLVVVSSRDEAERQVGAYGVVPKRVHRLTPGVEMGQADEDAARSLLSPFLRDLTRPLILAVARPVRKKNLPALLDAYAASPALRERANLAIVAGLRDGPDSGEAEQREVIGALLAGMDRHDLYGRLALPRRHDAAHVPGLYEVAARTGGLFVNPALAEPFGLTLIEAAAAGLPVVATGIGGPVDIVGDLANGLLVDPNDEHALGSAMLRLLQDRALWSRASRNGRRGVANYSWDAYAAGFVQAVRDWRPDAGKVRAALTRRVGTGVRSPAYRIPTEGARTGTERDFAGRREETGS
ncbi:MAG: glycosyltransferase [Jannaschia sp.]